MDPLLRQCDSRQGTGGRSHALCLRDSLTRLRYAFLGSIYKQNLCNISAEGLQLILSTFSCLILKLKPPLGTSFGLYFDFEEYRADDSYSPTNWYHTSDLL